MPVGLLERSLGRLRRLRLMAGALAALLTFAIITPAANAGTALTGKARPGPDIAALSLMLFNTFGDARQKAIDALVATGDRRLIPTFVLAMRWSGDDTAVAKGLSTLTGSRITDWHEAYDWQEAHPEIAPHPTYRPLKLRFLGNTDQRFLEFFAGPLATREAMKIRLEEVTWGGVLVDEIPALDRPKMIPAAAADYLLDTDLVFGVEINGDVRAYPLRIMGWHEMLNDVIGGVPVALAYCTLCGAGILFETQPADRPQALVFGSSGLLYRSNKLMFDRETKSLWNQFTGKPVAGPLVTSDVALKQRPILTTTWREWRARHPETQVLSLQTGHIRDYGSGVTYRDYFASPDLLFPARVGDETVAKRKDFVFGVRDVGAAKAWPVRAFQNKPVINDEIGGREIVLIGDAASRTVRAFDRGGEVFAPVTGNPNRLHSASGSWRVTETFLVGDDGRRLPRIAGHLSYWFAWNNYLGPKSDLYEDF